MRLHFFPSVCISLSCLLESDVAVSLERGCVLGACGAWRHLGVGLASIWSQGALIPLIPRMVMLARPGPCCSVGRGDITAWTLRPAWEGVSLRGASEGLSASPWSTVCQMGKRRVAGNWHPEDSDASRAEELP